MGRGNLIDREALKKHKVYSHERHEYVVPVYNIDNAPTVEPCKDCEDRKQAEYIRHGSSWHELQALRKFKEEHERPQGELIETKHRLNLLIGVLYSNQLISESDIEYIEDSIKELMKGGTEE